eukprot:COSAG01_NODE_69942_length_260_cov_0.565217_1_plen_59_part_01
MNNHALRKLILSLTDEERATIRRRASSSSAGGGSGRFFKQKTAYEISECDWSSDVCSSD